jgi:ribose 5-phosphate isomerase A
MSDAHSLKQAVAKAALGWVEPGSVIGVGTGSTVDCFIDALAQSGIRLAGAVSSSVRTEHKLRAIDVPILDLNQVGELGVYVDGADEVDPEHCMIKGGGGALTREKIVAEVARQFVCIADASKAVGVLGQFPLPIEVLPSAAALIMRKLQAMGGRAQRREGFLTDNGNLILDVSGLRITDPVALEQTINQWPGVVTNGLFALRRADVVCLATTSGIRIFQPGEVVQL